MLPKVIMHNTISVDGSIKNFDINVGLHYQIAARCNADVHLVGSRTAKTGIEMFLEEMPLEEESDLLKPVVRTDDQRPYWAISDTRGMLKGLLHMYRRSGYCKDMIILVSRTTPKNYIEYLKTRDYDYLVLGEDRVDYRKALKILSERYNARTVLTDSGGKLNCILLEKGLVDEISILISPVLVGNENTKLFGSLNIKEKIKLKLEKNEIIDEDHILIVYKVMKQTHSIVLSKEDDFSILNNMRI